MSKPKVDRRCRECDNEVAPRRTYCSSECIGVMRRRLHAEKMYRSPEERLWSRVAKLPSGCWEWQGYRMPFGYGQIGIGKRLVLTHRLAWELTNGPIPDGLILRHSCDNPPCVNPGHLSLGTHQDNVNDMVQRNRGARLFDLPHTVLSDEDVATIRREYWREGNNSNARDLALRYGVTKYHITEIVAGRERAA